MTIDNQNVGLRRVRRPRPTSPAADSADGSDNLHAYRNSKNSKGRTSAFPLPERSVLAQPYHSAASSRSRSGQSQPRPIRKTLPAGPFVVRPRKFLTPPARHADRGGKRSLEPHGRVNDLLAREQPLVQGVARAHHPGRSRALAGKIAERALHVAGTEIEQRAIAGPALRALHHADRLAAR